MANWTRTVSVVVACSILAGTASASVNYQDEYDKKIKAAQNIAALGDDLAGDSVNYYTGAVSFHVTDISVPTNSLPLTLGRTRGTGYDDMLAAWKGPDIYTREIFGTRKHAFGDWDLDVPAITTTMTQEKGWIVDTQTPDKRCSVAGKLKGDGVTPADGQPPQEFSVVDPGFRFHPDAYWSGYSMRVLGGGEQTLLLANLPNSERPSKGGPFHWTTNQDWWLSCVDAGASDGGEAFLAISPQGVRYTFARLGKRNITSTTDRNEVDMEGYGNRYRHYVYRAEYALLATRIEDRFGNWIAYDWSDHEYPQLRSIQLFHAGSTIPDQQITLSYDPATQLIASATDGLHTWRYDYAADAELAVVTLPDTSVWRYDFGGLGWTDPPKPFCDTAVPYYDAQYQWVCFGDGTIAPQLFVATIDHPSGARIEFTLENHFQYANNMLSYPLGITRKTISGPGLAPATWRFGFLPSKNEIRDACHYTTCPTRIMTDALAPDGSLNRRIFGVSHGVDETVLLGELRGSSGTNGGGSPALATSPRWGADILDDVSPLTGAVPVFYSESDFRRVPDGQAMPYTVQVGANPMVSPAFPAVQVYESERRLPIVTRYLRQQGVEFKTDTTLFDNFARPLQVTHSNDGAAGSIGARREASEYRDNRASWVLGQLARSLVDDVEVSRTEFDSVSDLPTKTYAFGFPQSVVAYNADGTVATVTDGRGFVTRVSEWKAGVPGLIQYPTGYAESADIGPTGLIRSTTNESGATTAYGYDTADRLARITYAPTPGVTWNDTTRDFARIDTAEYTLPAGHWRMIAKTGTGVTTTYYDGRWHPVLTTTEDSALAGSRTLVWRRFDNLGREVFQSYPVGSPNDPVTGVTTTYDALGRVTRVSQDSELGPLVSTTDYLAGLVVRQTNPRGYQTSTRFQVFDSPSTDFPIQIDSPEGVQTRILRDVFGKPRTITRSGPGGS